MFRLMRGSNNINEADEITKVPEMRKNSKAGIRGLCLVANLRNAKAFSRVLRKAPHHPHCPPSVKLSSPVQEHLFPFGLKLLADKENR